ncbi:DUF6882 domain-containing protein [Streptomyces sp. S.PB5]|uniref:DUF6882 domain-containing protein n=1 Tax=Streptomyces sp. S.PB5 TaxID=3020844 RepID=UPI00339D7254
MRDWAEAHGHQALAAPQIDADEQVAATLTALAVRVTGATGFCRGSGGNSMVMITFGRVALAMADGSASTFNININ